MYALCPHATKFLPILLLQEAGFAEFNGGDAISAAVLFSSVRPIAAGKWKVKETLIDGTAAVKAEQSRSTIALFSNFLYFELL